MRCLSFYRAGSRARTSWAGVAGAVSRALARDQGLRLKRFVYCTVLENDLLDFKSFSLNLKQKTGIRILVIVLPILQAVNSVMTDKEVIP